jgi:hypothetical protein
VWSSTSTTRSSHERYKLEQGRGTGRARKVLASLPPDRLMGTHLPCATTTSEIPRGELGSWSHSAKGEADGCAQNAPAGLRFYER